VIAGGQLRTFVHVAMDIMFVVVTIVVTDVAVISLGDKIGYSSQLYNDTSR
jgi:hypothetical protein